VERPRGSQSEWLHGDPFHLPVCHVEWQLAVVIPEQVRIILCRLLRESVFISVSHSLHRRFLFDGGDLVPKHTMIPKR
jgi:hypothetical protein